MSDAYRDDHEAALRQLDALRRENETLREKLASAQSEAGEPGEQGDFAAEPGARPSAVLALMTGVFFLAGAVTMAGASRGRCPSMRGSQPCPYSARWAAAHGEGAFERGARLLRNEPGMIRVELAPGNEMAQVRVDGMVIPRSGATALSGPLASGATHVVDVSAGGFIQSRTRVSVGPGRTEVVRVALAADPSPKHVHDEKAGEE